MPYEVDQVHISAFDVKFRTQSSYLHDPDLEYASKLKAEVVANFLNLLDGISDDDTEQLDEINGFLGF